MIDVRREVPGQPARHVPVKPDQTSPLGGADESPLAHVALSLPK